MEFYLILSFVGLLISIIIVRWVFSVEKFLSYQKAQTELLVKIAEQNNVPSLEIKEIIDGVDKTWGKKYEQTLE